MFAHDLCQSQIEYLSNSTRREPQGRTIDLNRKRQSDTRRKRLRLRPVSLREAYGLEALRERYHKSSIVNIQFRLVRVRYCRHHVGDYQCVRIGTGIFISGFQLDF